jgi:calcineurin-like phosphoesterase family protein
MNNEILDRWNSVVSDNDDVFFVGDLAVADSEAELWTWFGRLPGNIKYLYGNHCPVGRSEFSDSDLPLYKEEKFERQGYSFQCVHKYEWSDDDWSGWTIHGHDHEKEPFINPEKKRVNVSVDDTDFEPVSVSEIIELIERRECITDRTDV